MKLQKKKFNIKDYIDRFWYATIYPKWWYLYSFITFLITLIIQKPINNLIAYYENYGKDFSSFQYFIVFLILTGFFSFIIIKLYITYKICHLSFKGWKEYSG